MVYSPGVAPVAREELPDADVVAVDSAVSRLAPFQLDAVELDEAVVEGACTCRQVAQVLVAPCVDVVVVEQRALSSQVHASAGGSDAVVVDVGTGAGRDGVSVDVLLVVLDVVVVDLDVAHGAALGTHGDAPVATLGEDVVVDMDVAAVHGEPHQRVAGVVAVLDLGDAAVDEVVVDGHPPAVGEVQGVRALEVDVGGDAGHLGVHGAVVAGHGRAVRVGAAALDDVAVEQTAAVPKGEAHSGDTLRGIVPEDDGMTPQIQSDAVGDDLESCSCGADVLGQQVTGDGSPSKGPAIGERTKRRPPTSSSVSRTRCFTRSGVSDRNSPYWMLPMGVILSPDTMLHTTRLS